MQDWDVHTPLWSKTFRHHIWKHANKSDFKTLLAFPSKQIETLRHLCEKNWGSETQVTANNDTARCVKLEKFFARPMFREGLIHNPFIGFGA